MWVRPPRLGSAGQHRAALPTAWLPTHSPKATWALPQLCELPFAPFTGATGQVPRGARPWEPLVLAATVAENTAGLMPVWCKVKTTCFGLLTKVSIKANGILHDLFGQ